jgi:hypothetical protein
MYFIARILNPALFIIAKIGPMLFASTPSGLIIVKVTLPAIFLNLRVQRYQIDELKQVLYPHYLSYFSFLFKAGWLI